MLRNVFALIVALLSVACTSRESELRDRLARVQSERSASPDNGEGRLYINALADAIEKSDRIVVTEHSNVDDVLDEATQPQRPENYQPIVFNTHELSPVERANFLASVRSMAVTTQDAEPACIFEPHHTMTFFRANKQTSAMRICFRCGQVEWDGSTRMRPWSLAPTLGDLIAGLGMKEQRDWRALAKAAAK